MACVLSSHAVIQARKGNFNKNTSNPVDPEISFKLPEFCSTVVGSDESSKHLNQMDLDFSSLHHTHPITKIDKFSKNIVSSMIARPEYSGKLGI